MPPLPLVLSTGKGESIDMVKALRVVVFVSVFCFFVN
jgi:hypothetical protein